MIHSYEKEVVDFLEKARDSLTSAVSDPSSSSRDFRDLERYVQQASLSLNYMEMEVSSLPSPADQGVFADRIQGYKDAIVSIRSNVDALSSLHTPMPAFDDLLLSESDHDADDEPLLGGDIEDPSQPAAAASLSRLVHSLTRILERGQTTMSDLNGAHESVQRADDVATDMDARLDQGESQWGRVRSKISSVLSAIIVLLVLGIAIGSIWIWVIKPMWEANGDRLTRIKVKNRLDDMTGETYYNIVRNYIFIQRPFGERLKGVR